MKIELKPYMGWVGSAEDGAVLIFAHNAREAKKIGWPVCRDWGALFVRMKNINLKKETKMQKCSCGYQVVVPNFIFCPKCGAKLPEVETPVATEELTSDVLAATIAGALADPEIRNQVALSLSGALRRLAKRFDL